MIIYERRDPSDYVYAFLWDVNEPRPEWKWGGATIEPNEIFWSVFYVNHSTPYHASVSEASMEAYRGNAEDWPYLHPNPYFFLFFSGVMTGD